MPRELLPNRRVCTTFEMRHGDQNSVFAITAGCYDDGRIGEVFISGPKAGSDIDAIARDAAVLLSIALQYGVPLETVKHAITRNPDSTAITIIGAVVDQLLQQPRGEWSEPPPDAA